MSEASDFERVLPSYCKYEIRKRSPNPSKCALLVIDMQNHFSDIANPIIPALNTTINLCRSRKIPVLFTRHNHKSPSDYGMLGEWWDEKLIFDGTPDADLLPNLALDKKVDLVVEKKNTYSAFHGTGMEEILREMEIEEVIITGVMTNLCCETSARDAFVRGFRVFVSTDSTATSNTELHESTLKNMAYGFAYLVDCKRLESCLKIKEKSEV